MNSFNRFLFISCGLGIVLALACAPIHAGGTRIKGGSGYGGTDPLGSGSAAVTDCAQMLNPPYPEGCQAYSTDGTGTLTVGGLPTTVNEYNFSDDSDAGVIFDVFDLGAGKYTDVNVALGGSTLGVFACDGSQLDFTTPSQVSYSSNQSNFGIPCSPILANATGAAGTLDAGGNPFLFTLNADGSVTFGSTTNPIPSTDDVVVFVVPSAATPEPATLTLMGFGLLALAGGLLARRAA
jgi:hypothetical protein